MATAGHSCTVLMSTIIIIILQNIHNIIMIITVIKTW